jgi:hypothetical protein
MLTMDIRSYVLDGNKNATNLLLSLTQRVVLSWDGVFVFLHNLN